MSSVEYLTRMFHSYFTRIVRSDTGMNRSVMEGVNEISLAIICLGRATLRENRWEF